MVALKMMLAFLLEVHQDRILKDQLWTCQEACGVDQFEQHLRCVLGLPLGDCQLSAPANNVAETRVLNSVPGTSRCKNNTEPGS